MQSNSRVSKTWLESNSLFSKQYELAHLIAPITLLVAAIFEIFLSHRYFSNEALTLNFIQNILFLNSLHVWFTYLLLWSNRGARTWTSTMFNTPLFAIRCAIVFCFFAGFYFFFREVASGYRWGSTVVDAVLIFSGRHHEIAQSRGVSLLYDSKFGSPETKKTSDFKAIQWSQSIFGFSSATFSFLVLNTYQTRSPLYNVAEKSFRNPAFEVLFWLSLFISFACLVTLFVCTHRLYPSELGALKKKKFLFNLRYVIKLLSYHSSIAAFFSNVTHGVEYIAVYSKLDKQEERTVSNRTFRWFLGTSVALFIIFRYPLLFGSYVDIRDSSMIVSAMMSLIAGLTFLHYFIDGHLFQHRSEASRQHIIKRLVD